MAEIGKNVQFYPKTKELENVSEFKYLGIYLSRSGTFNAATNHIAEQANKAPFSFIRNIRTLNVSYDVKIDLIEEKKKASSLFFYVVAKYGALKITILLKEFV